MKKSTIFASLAIIATALIGINHAQAYNGGKSHIGIDNEYEQSSYAHNGTFGHRHRGHGDCYYSNAN